MYRKNKIPHITHVILYKDDAIEAWVRIFVYSWTDPLQQASMVKISWAESSLEISHIVIFSKRDGRCIKDQSLEQINAATRSNGLNPSI